MKRLYLAGPDVFRRDAREIGRSKQAICARHGLVGVYPLDLAAVHPAAAPAAQGLAIHAALERGMHDCDGGLFELTPFRGPSADVGTAFELGFLRALGKPVFAYSADARSFAERVLAHYAGHWVVRPDGSREVADGMLVEEFDLSDNLMLDGAVQRSTGVFVAADVPRGDDAAALANFEDCVRSAAAWFAARS